MAIVVPRPPFDTGIDVALSAVQQVELDAQRKITHAFIMSKPLELIITPRTRTVTDAGGWTYVATADRDAQNFLLIETMRQELATPTSSLDGVERKYDFMLLGEYDAIIAVGDTFTYDGDTHEVIETLFDLQYEVRAKVTRHGG